MEGVHADNVPCHLIVVITCSSKNILLSISMAKRTPFVRKTILFQTHCVLCIMPIHYKINLKISKFYWEKSTKSIRWTRHFLWSRWMISPLCRQKKLYCYNVWVIERDDAEKDQSSIENCLKHNLSTTDEWAYKGNLTSRT